ncbi:hypothetical protein WA026_015574 [Henosepilachna vigintioctopunctata]|uniref:Uncharacterized protein n=1 Tax=Henosepilachna vigintioctopunctata TaxID=420089 RepID=A0AAW1VA80_9CUCU
MSAEFSKSFHPSKRRGTPIPVAPPRVPTPMPAGNNNNATRTSQPRDVLSRSNLTSAGQDTPQLISKAAYKLLDNDVKTAWINPRLISKHRTIWIPLTKKLSACAAEDFHVGYFEVEILCTFLTRL